MGGRGWLKRGERGTRACGRAMRMVVHRMNVRQSAERALCDSEVDIGRAAGKHAHAAFKRPGRRAARRLLPDPYKPDAPLPPRRTKRTHISRFERSGRRAARGWGDGPQSREQRSDAARERGGRALRTRHEGGPVSSGGGPGRSHTESGLLNSKSKSADTSHHIRGMPLPASVVSSMTALPFAST